MLFLTVYGPELESIFYYVHRYTKKEGSLSRERLYSAYLPQTTLQSKGQTKNIEDAINYLKSAGLIEGNQTYCWTKPNLDESIPFAALLLRQFRQLEQTSSQLPLLDLLYITLLEQLFIAPNQNWISDLHAATNQLALAQQIGGISQEKVGAWKRVMEFLGLGYRMGSGFYCLYQPEIVHFIAQQWSLRVGSLQEFFEKHLETWAPCLTERGEVAQSIAHTLEYLAQKGYIDLQSKQDSPFKPYFGTRRLRGIQIV